MPCHNNWCEIQLLIEMAAYLSNASSAMMLRLSGWASTNSTKRPMASASLLLRSFSYIPSLFIFQVYNSVIDIDLHPPSLELELAVSATDSDAVSDVPVALMTDLEINDRCDRMSAHLKSRCQGLLEVHEILDRNWESVPDLDDKMRI